VSGTSTMIFNVSYYVVLVLISLWPLILLLRLFEASPHFKKAYLTLLLSVDAIWLCGLLLEHGVGGFSTFVVLHVYAPLILLIGAMGVH
jgi:hypothetical protein